MASGCASNCEKLLANTVPIRQCLIYRLWEVPEGVGADGDGGTFPFLFFFLLTETLEWGRFLGSGVVFSVPVRGRVVLKLLPNGSRRVQKGKPSQGTAIIGQREAHFNRGNHHTMLVLAGEACKRRAANLSSCK